MCSDGTLMPESFHYEQYFHVFLRRLHKRKTAACSLHRFESGHKTKKQNGIEKEIIAWFWYFILNSDAHDRCRNIGSGFELLLKPIHFEYDKNLWLYLC
ncbi:MAG: hypothetical protein C0397_19100 [Odoribacter sp.]|nr:hypothetical protein [Odoribacter sp.]